jgi:hypothetical protein
MDLNRSKFPPSNGTANTGLITSRYEILFMKVGASIFAPFHLILSRTGTNSITPISDANSCLTFDFN